MRSAGAWAAAGVVLVSTALSVGGSAFPDGAPEGSAAGGCGAPVGCHGPVADANVGATVDGLPEAYSPGQVYALTVSITGAIAPLPVAMNQGGFAMAASAGALAPVDDTTQDASGYVTHTEAGNDQRSWGVQWTAPAAGAGAVTFDLSVNAVNGDGVNDILDRWNTVQLSVAEGAAGPGGGPGAGGGTTPPPADGDSTDGNATDDDGGGIPAPGVGLVIGGLAAAAAAFARRRR